MTEIVSALLARQSLLVIANESDILSEFVLLSATRTSHPGCVAGLP